MACLRTTLFLTVACLALCAQPGAPTLAPPAASGKPVEVSGKVGQIRIAPGQGMPSFDLKQGDETIRVYLGPMPFLIAENFNPKAGQDVVVKGYKLEDRIIASQVTLVADKRTIKFRDEQGWPVWRGGFGRGRGRQ